MTVPMAEEGASEPTQITAEGAQGAALRAACVERQSAMADMESAGVAVGAVFRARGSFLLPCCFRSVGCSTAALIPGPSPRLRWPPWACATATSAGLP
jgi:hypothetical protein